MHAYNRLSVLVVLGFVAFGVAGCNSRIEGVGFVDDLVPAKGRVTLNGEALSGATVRFRPDVSAEGGRGAVGITDSNGVYELATAAPGLSPEDSKGTLPGDYVVIISRIAMSDGSPLPEDLPSEEEAMELGAKQWVPAQYTNPESSPLRVTVAPPEAENDFEL